MNGVSPCRPAGRRRPGPSARRPSGPSRAAGRSSAGRTPRRSANSPARARILWVATRARRFDVFAAVMLGVFLVGLGLSFLTGSPKFLLIKESFGTGIAGLAFVVSCFVGRPLIYHAALRMQEGDPAKAAEFEQKWRDLPGFRRSFRVMSATWGAGLLFDAAARIPLVLALSTSAAVTASTVLFIATMVILAAWQVRYIRRIQARAAAAEAAVRLA
ncbi:VC0807 family protein [Dactylosporangium sp. NPDC000244]|uniref:VC0807 family protein n=1 Tax=Dactylosporangium sp. NPDC000244 TaxID=3154365 RepID=UPI0033305BF0